MIQDLIEANIEENGDMNNLKSQEYNAGFLPSSEEGTAAVKTTEMVGCMKKKKRRRGADSSNWALGNTDPSVGIGSNPRSGFWTDSRLLWMILGVV